MTLSPAGSGSSAAGRTIAASSRLVRNADPLFTYAALLGFAEFLVVFVSTPVGLVLHVVVLLACVAGYVRRPDEGPHRVLAALALVPVIRMLGLTMPLEDLPRWSWYVLAGLPLLAGTAVMTWRLGVSPGSLGLSTPARPWMDVAMICVGLALGLVAFPLGASPNLVGGGAMAGVATALALLLFVAVPEELVFRGLLHRLAADAHGAAGISMIALLYATMFLTSFSVSALLIMGIAGAAFAWSIERGGSLWGTISAHAILVIGAALVWPAMLG